ncbi:hypothetical protein DVH24_013839 [Malus domestica]|uniref:Uncharacterized protein n=1 Tax=Malus domestica TaxID=3750 RepID=A0A498JHN0_MALDO|nr:hypothetical protein DVH24_013839 [Malus domestica]
MSSSCLRLSVSKFQFKRSMKAEWVRSVALQPHPPNATPSLCFSAMALVSTSPPPSMLLY